MTQQNTLELLLQQLISEWENELVEFKQADESYPTSKIGQYFSALSNEANLHNHEKAWLIFGVDNTTRTIKGCNYRRDKEHLHSLKYQIAQGTEPSITFRDIHELHTEKGRVLLLEIPAAPLGMPIAWNGHYYARSGESLSHLGLDKLDRIRQQVGSSDWSAQTVIDATVKNLDSAALKKAKEAFAHKYANRFELNEVLDWPDEVFLDRVKLTINGKITKAALLLVGSPESAHFLSPYPAQITWKLVGEERAYEHFYPPFLLTTSFLYNKIRNVQLRILPANELVAIELAKYDQKIVLEALHNCIAHQDYSRHGRIIVTEFIDRLTLENLGGFYDGEPGDYVTGHKTPRQYRNPFLTQAMTELGMIDTMGYGIHEMYTGQARRYFPLPDYDLKEPQTVKITIYGHIVDLAYTRMLIQKTDLTLDEIIALDRVQKHLPLPDDTIKHLRKEKLIEGRKPNFHVSAFIADATATKAAYIHNRAQDNRYYQKLIIDYLEQFKSATRKEIDNLLWNKLSDALEKEQKLKKIDNLLTQLRNSGQIQNISSRKSPTWTLQDNKN
ncbi:MAG: putative DNA binding domain-containing protein [Legionella sp.]|uniref:RNA-binding domain-containing protein n=1 Tax=Legionella sp. TaxID=459 RepID=UPI0039E363B7